MQRNVELLQQTMQYIKDHPEQHDQSEYWDYGCQTPSCFAGWALHFNGVTWKEYVKRNKSTHIWASEVLGLTDDEAYVLFHDGNTRRMLELMTKDLVNGDELLPRREYWEMIYK
jgi:hypothetical protein